MEIRWVVLGGFVGHDEGGRVSHITYPGTDMIMVPEFPAPVQVSMIVRVAADPEEFERWELHSLVTGPQMQILDDGAVGIESITSTWRDARIVPAQTLGLAVEFEAPGPGVYTIDVHLGDGKVTSNSLLICLPPAA